MKLTGENRSTRGETCPSATLSTTNPTWTNPGSNPGLRGGRPAANRLSHGTVIMQVSPVPCFFGPLMPKCLPQRGIRVLEFDVILQIFGMLFLTALS
jgi:hypothetical protein